MKTENVGRNLISMWRKGVIVALAVGSWSSSTVSAAGVNLAFEAQQAAHLEFEVSYAVEPGDSLLEPATLLMVRPGGAVQQIASAPVNDPGQIVGTVRISSLAPGDVLQFQLHVRTTHLGTQVQFLNNAAISPTGAIQGTLLFDETLSALPSAASTFWVNIPSERTFNVTGVGLATPLYIFGTGTVKLDGVQAPQIGGDVLPAEAGGLTLKNCVISGSASMQAAGSLSVDGCFFSGPAGLAAGGAVSVSNSDFYGAPSSCLLSAAASEVEAVGNVFAEVARFDLSGLHGGLAPSISGNSFLAGLTLTSSGAPAPAGINLSGNYWGGAAGPLVAAREWLDGRGFSCGVPEPEFSFLRSGRDRATSHAAVVPPSPVIIHSGVHTGQNVLGNGGFVRKGREILVAVDAHTKYGTRSATELRLQVGSLLISPLNSGIIQQSNGMPDASEGNQDRTVNFVIPPRDEDLFDYRILDTNPPPGSPAQIYSGTIVQRDAPGRLLRLAVLPLVISGYRNSFLQANPGTIAVQSLRKQMAAMLPLKASEIEIDLLPAERYKLGYTGLYVLVSRTFMLNECSLVLRGFLDRLNARRTEPYDFLVTVLPVGTLGNGVLGASLPWRTSVILVDEVSPESAIHELGHGLGLYDIVEQYTVAWDGYDSDGYYYRSGYGARVEGVSAFVPGDAAPVSPISHRIRHFPAKVDSNVWDIMGGDGAQWIIPPTHSAFGDALLGRLAVPAPAPSAGKSSPRSTPLAGYRRVLMEGVIDPTNGHYYYFPVMRESLRCGIAPADMAPITGGWGIGHQFQAFNAAGTQVFQADCKRTISDGVLQPWTQTFDVPETATRYEIRDIWTGEVVFIQRATPGLGVTVGIPASAPGGGAVELNWTTTGESPSGRPFDTSLYDSSDGGATWDYLGDYDELTSITLPHEHLPPGGAVRFKITLSDGVSLVESISASYQVTPSSAAGLAIVLPKDGSTAPVETRWMLSGAVSPESPGQTAQWQSSRDGLLGDGFQLSGVVLSAGTHTLTLTLHSPGLPDVQRQVNVTVADVTQIDLSLAAAQLSFSAAGLDPIQGSAAQPLTGRRCRVKVTVDNPGIRHTARMQLFIRPPGGTESLGADEIFEWVPQSTHETYAEFTPSIAGDYQFRAVISHVLPSGITEINPGNNQRQWSTANMRPEGHAVTWTSREGQPLNLLLTASDADDDTLEFSLVTPPTHGTLSGNAPQLTYRSTAGFVGVDQFSFRSADAIGWGGTSVVTIRVVPNPPSLASAASVVGEQHHPFTYLLAWVGTNVDSSVTVPPYFSGLTYSPATHTVTGTTTRAGTADLIASLENAVGRIEPHIQVEMRVNDDPAVLSSSKLVRTKVGEWLNYQATALYGPTSFEFQDLPAGVFYNPTGSLSGTPEVAGYFTVRVGIANNTGTHWEAMALRVENSNLPPSSATTSAYGALGQPFSYQIRASGQPYRYSVSSLPVGLVLDSATGLITGIPEQVGSIPVSVEFSNLFGTGSALLWFSIDAPSSYPLLTSTDPLYVTGGVAVDLPMTATNGPVTYQATGLPNGLVIHPTTGHLTGSALQAGTFHPVIRLSNASGSTATAISLTVTPGAAQPSFTSSPFAAGVQGATFDYLVSATNAPTFTVSGLPSGLSFNTATRRITGPLWVPGVHAITLQASNAAGQSSMTLLLTVTADFAGWAALGGLTGANAAVSADPDHDGAVNLAEFMANSDPLAAASRPLFVVTGAAGNPYGSLRFRCRPAESGLSTGAFLAAGVDCVLQTAGDLALSANWAADPSQFGAGNLIQNADGTVDVLLPLLGDPALPRMFYRLHYEK